MKIGDVVVFKFPGMAWEIGDVGVITFTECDFPNIFYVRPPYGRAHVLHINQIEKIGEL